MSKANFFASNGTTLGTIDLDDNLFGLKPRSHHLWREITTHLSRQRLGTVQTKTRAHVSGGGKKPFRQKGTGNARQGSIRAVQFVGGGIAHGPKPRNYFLEIPKKMKRQALAESLSAKAQNGKVVVVENLAFEKPNTKTAKNFLKTLGLDQKKCLIVLDSAHIATFKSFRNLPLVTVLPGESLNTYETVNHETVVFTQKSLGQLVARERTQVSKIKVGQK